MAGTAEKNSDKQQHGRRGTTAVLRCLGVVAATWGFTAGPALGRSQPAPAAEHLPAAGSANGQAGLVVGAVLLVGWASMFGLTIRRKRRPSSGRHRGRPLWLLLAPVVVVVGASGVWLVTAGRDSPASDHPAASFTAASEAVCAASAAARAGDFDAARRAFVDRAHQPLHELAAAVGPTRGDVAARLLEAKARVERDLLQPDDRLSTDLDSLVQATAAVGAVAGGPGPEPCGTEPR